MRKSGRTSTVRHIPGLKPRLDLRDQEQGNLESGCQGRCACEHLRASGHPPYPRGPRSGPGYAVPVHLRLLDPIRPSCGHISTSMPRRPSTGSELSLMVFRNMSSSQTTGNFPAALTQYFTGNIGLRHGINVSAFPSSSHSDPGEECISRLDFDSFALRPVALLALLSEQTRLASSRRGRLHPGFHRLGHPRRRRICLQCQLGNLHWRDSHPLDHQLASLHYPGALIHIAAPPAGPRAFPAMQERSMQPG